MKLSIFGSSEIINHHIKAAKNNSFKIFGIYTSNPKSVNVKKLASKFKIKNIYYSWKSLIQDSYRNKCAILIAGRINDNEKILDYAIKKGLKILIEKPVFEKSKKFQKFIKFRENIFVGYNRVFYNGVARLKREISHKAPYNVVIKCPEINKKNIFLNTCHIISILYYFFGKINLIKKIKNNNSIFCLFETRKKIMIFINISFKSYDNFSFELNFNNKRAKLKPIENLIMYNDIEKINYKNTTIYKPKISEVLNEYDLTNHKPGFDQQYKNFNRFVKNKKTDFISINDAKNIITICEKIIN